jgi:hypothetical protein
MKIGIQLFVILDQFSINNNIALLIERLDIFSDDFIDVHRYFLICLVEMLYYS